MPLSKQKEEELRKEFGESSMSKYYGACFECCDFEKMMGEIQDFWLSKLSSALEEDRKRIQAGANDYCFVINDQPRLQPVVEIGTLVQIINNS